jgi:hypothetical protein
MMAAYLNPIRLIWSNMLVVKQLFAHGLMGCLVGVVTGLLCFVVDVIGSLVGLVMLLPVLLIVGLFKLIFGRF